MNLEGRVAIVTGAGKGVGRAIALHLAGKGAKLLVCSRTRKSLEELMGMLQNTGTEFVGREANAADLTEARDVAREALEAFGRVDILVNPIGEDTPQLFVDRDPAGWHGVLASNLYTTLNTTYAVLPTMLEQGYGRLIYVGTDAAKVGNKGLTISAAGKGGVNAFAKSLAREVARDQITVNVVSLGPTETPLLERLRAHSPELLDRMVRQIPMRRPARAEEIAAMVGFLASDDAAFITGQIISVSGGLTMA